MTDEPDAPDPKPGSEPEPEPEPADSGGISPAARARIQKANNEAKGLRERVKELEAKAARLDELEEAGKSEAEKMTARITDAERRATEAEAKALRLEVAAAKGLTPAQAKRLVGSTAEELETDADELLASFHPQDNGEPDESRRPVVRPKPQLTGGSNPTEPPLELDPAKLAAKVPRSGR